LLTAAHVRLCQAGLSGPSATPMPVIVNLM
jgi:hypothetical protein